jgi:hypothetical protein
MREPDEQQQEEQEQRRFRTAMGLLQIGGLGFLAMIAAGLLPRLLAAWYPALGKAWITAAAGSVAALGAVAFSVVRLRRIWRDSDRPTPGNGRAPPERSERPL